MKMSSAFPSKYVRAADLNDREVTVTIDRVGLESVGDDGHKPVLYFARSTKGMVLNKTNAKIISGAYGDETDGWSGKQIILYPAMVDFRGDMVEAIRVRIPRAKTAPAPVVPATPPPPSEPPAAQPYSEANPPPFDDEIPF